MKTNFFLLILLMIEASYVYLWKSCHSFKFISAISGGSISLQLDDFIHNDVGSFIFIRFFHNKVSLLIFEIIKKYLLLWDFRLILDITSLFGLIGIIFSLWFIIPLKKGVNKLILLFFLLPIIVLFTPNSLFYLSYAILFVTYASLSLAGWWIFFVTSSKKISQISFFIVLIFSICYFISFIQMGPYFCIR